MPKSEAVLVSKGSESGRGTSNAAGQINFHLSLTDGRHGSRFLKESTSLVQAGLFERALIVCRPGPGLSEYETEVGGVDIWRIPLRTMAWPRKRIFQAFKYLEWVVKAIRFLRRSEARVIQAHSLPALPVAVGAKLFRRCSVIYDAHELETEQFEISKLGTALAKITERFFIRWASVTLVVGDEIANWYRSHYPKVVVAVVRNGSPRQETLDNGRLRAAFAIPEGALMYLFQGSLTTGRSIDRMLKAFRTADSGKHLVFMGYGPMAPIVERAAQENKNIHFYPAVAPNEVLDYTAGADVGFCIIESLSLSYRYCLPNKFFQYLAASVPVIINDAPELAQIVRQYDCGWTAPDTPDGLIDLINSITPDEIRKKKANARQAGENLCWENEAQKLIQIYRKLLHMPV